MKFRSATGLLEIGTCWQIDVRLNALDLELIFTVLPRHIYIIRILFTMKEEILMNVQIQDRLGMGPTPLTQIKVEKYIIKIGKTRSRRNSFWTCRLNATDYESTPKCKGECAAIAFSLNW